MTKLVANPQRNEVVVTIGDKEFLTRASFTFIAEIEEYFDAPLASIIFDRLQNGKIKIVDLSVIIAAGIRGAGGNISMSEIQEALAEAGTVAATEALVTLIMTAFSGSNKIAKKK